MEFNYERKFQEMKKYIPFLESMIKRLEKMNSPENPRQAQLDKIKSLRDLLMDKRKRMKMDNLLKCEQVLFNLYTKVEKKKSREPDRSTNSETRNSEESRNTNLNVVRNKLKTVASKLHTHGNDTLPEIARANDVEESCVPGSKEPALFQRRPNISSSTRSIFPGCEKDFPPKNTEKEYSHLLLSPDRNPKPYTKDYSDEQSLFVRRSPKKSHRVVSPSYNRKERKKSLEEDVKVSKLKDLNITLQVPEDSLHSLNTKDIVSRIINCNDNDVDIETLRGLRTQILGELKETGSKEDISDIIIKSYKKDEKNKKSEEVEEGELSDSESETIENIYGSLVVMNKDKSNKIVQSDNLATTKPCKIQICLVINPEKQKESLPIENNKSNTNLDISDFELFENVDKQNNKTLESAKASNTSNQHDVIKPNVLQKQTSVETTSETQVFRNDTSQSEISNKSKQDASHNAQGIHSILNDNNRIDSLTKSLSESAHDEEKDHTSLEENQSFSEITHNDPNSFNALTSKQDVEIPLLNSQKSQSNSDKNEVSEIDILQALKNEILSETSNVLSSDVEAPLFQPKVTKVANAEEIGYKKRISIEKYKAKATNKSLPNCDTENNSQEDVLKKQSLKLTEKECERFFSTKRWFESFSDTEDTSNLSVDDVYEHLAPKSPDHEDFSDTGIKPPIIIPIDPVETPVVTSEKDIDMRQILPQDVGNIITPLPIHLENSNVFAKEGMLFDNNGLQISNLTDPRMNRDVTIMNHQAQGISVLSSNHPLNPINSLNENFSPNFNQIMAINMPGSTPNINVNLPPNRAAVTLSPRLAPNLTPNRIQNIGGSMTPNSLNSSMPFDTTPSRNSFDNDDNHKNLNTIYQNFESQAYNEKARKSPWSNDVPFWEDVEIPIKTSNKISVRENQLNSINSSNTSNKTFNKISVWENQLNSINSSNTIPVWEDVGNLRKPSKVRDNEYMATYDRYNVESREPYIRNDAQAASRHSFRRIDCPSATITSFSRYDCPPTPTHPFGRQEASMTSSHNFGRSEYTQVAFAQKFNKSQDRRIYRNPDYDNYHARDRDRERYDNYESKFNSISHDSDQCNRFNRLDTYRQHVGRQDRNKFYEQNESNFREPLSRRETDCRQYNRELEGERFFTRHRGGSSNYNHRRQNESNSYDKRNRRCYNIERSNSKNTRDLSPSLPQSPQTLGSVLSKDKKIGVHSDFGNSLLIDKSSKNSSIETKSGDKPKFDARRQRASSVGRSISSNSNESRGFHVSKQSLSITKSETMRRSFQRSSSVGREIRGGIGNFKDVKESLKSFKLKSDSTVSSYFKKTEEPGRAVSFVTSCKSSNKREIFESGKKSFNACLRYSPRKNNRDPRMCRESYGIKNKFKDKKNDLRDSKHCGIVYTNDNITKGTILGSGYGVKNYKIPKIKRNSEITETVLSDSIQGNEIKDNADNDCQKAAKGSEDKNKSLIDLSGQSLTKDVKLLSGAEERMEGKYEIQAVINKTDIESDSEKQLNNIQHLKEDKNVIVPETSTVNERRVTRSDTKNVSVEKSFREKSPILMTRKLKTLQKIKSDTDDNDSIISIQKDNSIENNKLNAAIKEKPNVDYKSLLCAANHCERTKNEFINSEVDDIEIFSDNFISNQIDNINDLIADLDDDLESHKILDSDSTDFSKDVSIENLIENDSNPCKNNKLNIPKNVQIPGLMVSTVVQNVKTDDTSLVTTNNEKGISSKQEDKQESNLEIGNTKEECISGDILINEENIMPLTQMTKNVELNNEAVVSTTFNHSEKRPANNSEVRKKITGDVDEMKTPDRIIENSDVPETKLDGNCLEMTKKPTIEMMDSDFSSTDNNVKTKADMIESSLPSTNKTQIESIGKLLSILQDKSKIKELLGLLGDQSSECEKIKKKLEKLSELVSDDEEVINDTETKNKEESQNKDKDPESQSKTQQIVDIVNSNDKTKSNDNVGEAVSESNNFSPQKEILCPLEINMEDCERLLEIKSANKEKEGPNTVENNVKTVIKKGSVPKKRKKKTFIKKTCKKNSRLAQSDTVEVKFGNPSVKKLSRELKNLQDDIREMFIRDDVLNSTGIRKCRMAKLADRKRNKQQESIAHGEPKPIVVLKKIKDIMGCGEDAASIEKGKKAKGKKIFENEIKNKSVQTSTVKPTENKSDPYDFETDSIKGTSNLSDKNDSSGSDFESLGSSKRFGSNELLTEIKKTKRRRRKGWRSGIIKSKCRKKSINQKQDENITEKESVIPQVDVTIPDLNCYIDKMYCFRKKNTTYDCRLCIFSGEEIVHHYKKHHPCSEIPCSRMSPAVAKSAITESKEVNIQAISKVTSKKFVCRFCFKEFSRNKPLIESFFWHVVSVHTGEYKQLCSEGSNDNSSPFILDIPPPPTEAKGQLLGYICGECNYTQISVENLKTHLILRHNDEPTPIYNINLASLTRPYINSILKEMAKDNENIQNDKEPSRVLRSSCSNISFSEIVQLENNSLTESSLNLNESLICANGDDSSENTIITNNIKSKITFENDIMDDISNDKDSDDRDLPVLKIGADTNDTSRSEPEKDLSRVIEPELAIETNSENQLNKGLKDLSEFPQNLFDCPHFKIQYNRTGSKEYICCINGNMHYRTTLLISFKKHVQMKHSEKWDGYCYVCKVIVTPQGTHFFMDCLCHFLDKHLDDFPILEETPEKPSNIESATVTENQPILVKQEPKVYINVRPISDTTESNKGTSESYKGNTAVSDVSKSPVLAVIENVISLRSPLASPRHSPSHHTTSNNSVPFEKLYKYEEVQAEIMSKKHRVVLDVMMSENKLGHVFKCSGRFCSFTSDSAEDAFLHASTHARLGGEDALNCVYCDFDCHQNAIDLITHVFKSHGSCQYICGKCFYRAAAGQLVKAHLKRIHDETTSNAILHTSFKTVCEEDILLSREIAVPHYICNAQGDSEERCKFKTYTPGKFCEHLQTRHASAADFKCFMCAAKVATPTDLVRHLKIHGLKLYQCCWCIHGADNEPELLAHASVYHPTKLPKAYLRIITNKEGLSDLRVLPLAHLTKSNVLAKEIIMSKVKDNPVKEAERSIELEKLLGQTCLKVETTAPSEETNTQYKDFELIFDNESEIRPVGLNDESILTMQSEFIPTRTSTPITAVKEVLSKNEKETLTKIELLNVEKTVENQPVIYCLDSDEDNSVQSSLESNNKASRKEIKVALKDLFMCAKCKMVLNTGVGLKRHMMWCYAAVPDPISCAHCSVKLIKSDVLNHYYEVHSLTGKPLKFVCTKCHREFNSAALLKEHRKLEHFNIANKNSEGTGAKQVDAPNKRKRSVGSKEKPVVPEKIRRYGPQDVDLLPINPILDDLVFCSLCEFNTKVKLNMVRHLLSHAQQQPVPQTAPVNPVPHLETNEKHFDKMVNLASSSIVTRTPDKNKTENTIVLLPSEAASHFPKYVTEKQRLTCGAKGCTYISVDESMLKCHWETLHADCSEFHCVHCAPHKFFDTSQPLTSSRIIDHLKMHDSELYACSLCTYYHHKREILQKHLVDTHKGGQVMVVREGTTTTSITNPVQNAAPTMDLKLWQCGLCNFKSLLELQVVDHCAKEHNSKMQYKCVFCEFRTSNAENISKHQAESHPEKPEEVFYYYYRKDSIPDEPGGTPKWQKQRQKNEIFEPQLKCEPPNLDIPPLQPLSTPVVSTVDLNLVKKEFIEPIEEKLQDICHDFGEFCDPNGLKYMCPLCKNVMEDDIETIQSHLYEELKYRKWGCSICSYKAFHKAGLSEHMQVEHCQNREPIALQIDHRVETWVNKLLEHQTTLIEKYKENLLKQKAEIFRTAPEVNKIQSHQMELSQNTSKSNNSDISIEDFNKIFGAIGAPVNRLYCCPKCGATFKEEDLMQNHLESELNKIRWFCSTCYLTFQTFHEAQFHCRSAHLSLRPAARPSEAPRDPIARDNWVKTVLAVQRLGMAEEPQAQTSPKKDSRLDESLLVVRYEENIPTPDFHQPQVPIPTDSDEEKLVIDEPVEKDIGASCSRNCTICGQVIPQREQMRKHILKHYNLKPYSCGYCSFNGTRTAVINHHKRYHAPETLRLMSASIPKVPPQEYAKKPSANVSSVICLVCKKSIMESEVKDHVHPTEIVSYAKMGDVVLKCTVCSALSKDLNTHLMHQQKVHKKMKTTTYTSLTFNPAEDKEEPMSRSYHIFYQCNKCEKKFSSMKELKVHKTTNCSETCRMPIVSINKMKIDDKDKVGKKRKNDDKSNNTSKKVAKKTTRTSQIKRFDLKSTTRLSTDGQDKGESSNKPNEELNCFKTMIPVCNKLVPDTSNMLNNIKDKKPVVVVEKINMDDKK
ncbi:unnamed protein product [Danaus chrysippus]|uniref:(African queen) hypothetical protein n=1 Tax=Danaus chrysippus TaxID=151541 RepID=A0A8J2MFL8_9NEOP|nr:unnamed protein product [Danaus chrysippus]